MSWRTRTGVLATGLLMACGKDASPTPRSTRTDSAGVAIVQGPAVDVALPWTFTELRRMGGADSGVFSFTTASGATVATDGVSRIAVLDREADNRVRLFTGEGAYLRSVGGKGGGPGETEYPNSLRVDTSGAASVFDENKNAIVSWDASGTPQPEYTVLSPRGRADEGPVRVGDTVFLSIHTNDSVSSIRRVERWTRTDSVVIARAVSAKPRMTMFKCVGLVLPPLFSGELTWTRSSMGLLASTSQSQYEVSVYRGTSLMRSVRRAIAPTSAKPSDAVKLYPEGLKVMFAGGAPPCVMPATEVGEKVGVAQFIPVIRRMLFAPDGFLWVERYTFTGETPAVDVFDAEGQYVGTASGRSLPLGFLGNDRVLFAIKNADDDTSVIGIFQISRAAAVR